MSILEANTLKPISSSTDLSLQGDSGGAAVDCLNIEPSGDINFTGNTDAKIKLPSAGGVYESNGTTPILTESSGVVSLQNVSHKTDTNSYIYANSGELNSKGYFVQNSFIALYYSTVNAEIVDNTSTEIGGSSSGLNVGFTVFPTSSEAGSAVCDPFAKFSTTTGRFTPTIAGFYSCQYSFEFSESLLDGAVVTTSFRRNGSNGNDYDMAGFQTMRVGAAGVCGFTGGGILNLDTTDYISLFIKQTGSGDGKRMDMCRVLFNFLGENL